MNASHPCDRLWRKRLTEFASAWPDFVAGRVTGLHKTRVASRRIREALPIVGVCAPPAKVKRLDRKMRELTRYLGPIRELDVELGILEGESKTRAVPDRAIEMVRREIASQRQALRNELAENAPVVDVKKLIKKMERVGRKGKGQRAEGRGQRAEGKYDAQWRGMLAARLVRRAKRLGTAVDEAGALYVPERIHGVRIATKKLRYALEIAQEVGLPRAAVLVRILKRQQERLGRLHDLQSLLKHVHEAGAAPGVGSRVNDLTAYADALERKCRRLHAGFVERREELAECIKEVRQQLVPALTLPSRGQVPVTSVARPAPHARARAK